MMRFLCTLLIVALAWTASAATKRNDDSCDIGVAPAATLLLPYFEVDLDDPDGETTVFTITNVTNLDRIARVTLWTDYAVPILTFNVQLTGYGVQTVNLHDVIARGVIGPTTTVARGRYSKPNPAASACDVFSRTLPPEALPYLRDAFTEGIVPGCYNSGGEHENAIGYATIDLVRNCWANNPTVEEYWTEDIAFDNVLIGDSQQIFPANDFAQGSPLVHIRAIPEGGGTTNLPRTFYARYQPAHAPKRDGRQPLPSVFAVRWTANTELKIWREGVTASHTICATHDDNVAEIAEMVGFDEAENSYYTPPTHGIPLPMLPLTIPATSRIPIKDASVFPQPANGATAGWMYLNLDNDPNDGVASGNWVVTSMRAEGRYSVDMDAAALGNGCSPPAPISEVTTGTATIGPRP